MNRREFLPLLGAPIMLTGCGGTSVTRNFRVIATAEVDGEKVESSTVMQVTYSKVTNSLMGAGGAATLKGEALILDLKGKGTVFILPYVVGTDGSLTEYYKSSLLSLIGIKGDIGTLDDGKLNLIKSVQGRFPFNRTFRGKPSFPVFVAFKDETSPRSVHEVDPQSFETSFPGTRFLGIEIEFTDAPVTNALLQRLPWLKNGWNKIQFERPAPGHHRPASETPLSQKISEGNFVALGSLRNLR